MGKLKFTPRVSVDDCHLGEVLLEFRGGSSLGVEEEVPGGGVGEEESNGLVGDEEIETDLWSAVFSFVALVAGLAFYGLDGVE